MSWQPAFTQMQAEGIIPCNFGFSTTLNTRHVLYHVYVADEQNRELCNTRTFTQLQQLDTLQVI